MLLLAPNRFEALFDFDDEFGFHFKILSLYIYLKSHLLFGFSLFTESHRTQIEFRSLTLENPKQQTERKILTNERRFFYNFFLILCFYDLSSLPHQKKMETPHESPSCCRYYQIDTNRNTLVNFFVVYH